MKRAIVVTIAVAVAALAVVLIATRGQTSELRRPTQETKRAAPGKAAGGFAPGTSETSENDSPADE